MSTQTELSLGSVIKHEEEVWRIVRIVDQISLLRKKDGKEVVLKEKFLQLKSPDGRVNFLILDANEQQHEVQKIAEVIQAPAYLPWRGGGDQSDKG